MFGPSFPFTDFLDPCKFQRLTYSKNGRDLYMLSSTTSSLYRAFESMYDDCVAAFEHVPNFLEAKAKCHGSQVSLPLHHSLFCSDEAWRSGREGLNLLNGTKPELSQILLSCLGRQLNLVKQDVPGDGHCGVYCVDLFSGAFLQALESTKQSELKDFISKNNAPWDDLTTPLFQALKSNVQNMRTNALAYLQNLIDDGSAQNKIINESAKAFRDLQDILVQIPGTELWTYAFDFSGGKYIEGGYGGPFKPLSRVDVTPDFQCARKGQGYEAFKYINNAVGELIV